MNTLPEPIVNADSQKYWEGVQNGKLLLQTCKDCNAIEYMPRHLCPSCWSPNKDWVEASGKGTVHTFSIVRRASSPDFASRVPYVATFIDLEEGPRMPSLIVGDNATTAKIGDAVTMAFESRGEKSVIVFELQR